MGFKAISTGMVDRDYGARGTFHRKSKTLVIATTFDRFRHVFAGGRLGGSRYVGPTALIVP